MLDGITPRLIPRRCGGWLAVSNEADPVKIGVTAASEAEATREFTKARERWRVILESEAAVSAAFAAPT
jgi:hypothetical protein